MSTACQRASFCAMLGGVVASISLWTSDAVVSFAAQQVPAVCVPPEFGDPPIIRPIDRATTGCDLDGEASASDPSEAAKQSAQNVMKNEFCAWRDTDPALVTRFSFDQLQKRLPAVFPWGSRFKMPTAEERKAIREFYATSEGDTIGEGSYVVFVAYLLEGHFGGAESVNCGEVSARTSTFTSRSSPNAHGR
jgi:hypothetical protein